MCGLRVVAAVDLLARRAIKVPDLQSKAGRLNECVGKSSYTNIVGLTLRWLDIVGAVRLDIMERDKLSVVLGMGLNPGAGKELHLLMEGRAPKFVWTCLDVGDDGHGDAHIVEGLEQDSGGGTVHGVHGFTQLAQQIESFLCEVHPDVARIANLIEQVAQGEETAFFFAKFLVVSHVDESFKVRESNGWAH